MLVYSILNDILFCFLRFFVKNFLFSGFFEHFFVKKGVFSKKSPSKFDFRGRLSGFELFQFVREVRVR